MSSESRRTRIGRPYLQRAVRVLAAALMLGLVLSLVDGRMVWAHLTSFDARIALAMLAVNVLLMALFAARWRMIAGALAIEAPYARFFCATWLGAFFSQLGPGVVLNEITRFRLLKPYADNWPLAASQVLDRVSGQVVLTAMVLLLTPYYLRPFTAEVGGRIVAVTALLVVSGGLVLALARRFRRFIRVTAGMLRAILNPVASPGHYACSLAIQLLLMANLWLASRGLDAAGPGIELYLIAPLILGTLTLLPISIADWGSREAVALVFFSATALTAEQIVAVSVIYGAINLISALPAALLLAVPASKTKKTPICD